MVELTVDDYMKRDYRLMCRCCKQWMRFKPTVNSPKLRHDSPYASICVDCFLRCPKALHECVVCSGFDVVMKLNKIRMVDNA